MSVFDEVADVLQEISSEDPQVQTQVSEAMNRVNMMLQLEDRGWSDLYSGVISGDNVPGPDLELVQSVSEQAREMSYGSPLIARGLGLRQSYIWSKGILLDAPEAARATKGKRGPKPRQERFLKDPKNVRYFLSQDGFDEMEAAAYNDGHYMFLGDDTTYTGHPLPFYEIDALYLNPDYSGEVWAYRRTYTPNEPGVKNPKSKSVWYYCDTYTGDRKDPEPENPNSEVDKSKTLFVKAFNSMVGWPLGTPDALPALKDARVYAEMKNDGRVVSKANAKFVYKVKNNTAAGAQNAAATVSTSGGVGNVAALGNNNDLISIPQANRSYDFNGLRPIAAQVATALNVSVIHLLSDPGAAGSSYGSASNLDLPTKRAMASRQQEWVEFLERLIKWGTGLDYTVSFPSLDDPDPYREGQLLTMIWNSGLAHADEIRPRMLQVGGVASLKEKPPVGVMMPNNEKSLNRRDVDADGEGGSSTGGTSVSSTAASPDQGTRNGTGGVADSTAKDLRNEQMAQDIVDLKEQLQALAYFLENRND